MLDQYLAVDIDQANRAWRQLLLVFHQGLHCQRKINRSEELRNLIYQKDVLYMNETHALPISAKQTYQILAERVSVTLCSLRREWQMPQPTLCWRWPPRNWAPSLSRQRRGLTMVEFSMTAAAISEEIGRHYPRPGEHGENMFTRP